jgi:hypothetical protein
MTRNTIWKLAFLLVLFPASTLAQLPTPTGTGPSISTSLGYSYLSFPVPSSARIDMNGVNASATADFRSRFGAKVDLNYVRQANVFGTGHHSDLLTYMLGPMFYPVSNDRWIVYLQALAGGSRADGVVPDGTGGFETAYADGFAWAIGGGIERRMFSSFALRTEANYVRTTFTNASAVPIGQSDLRFTGSLVYRWQWQWHSEGRRKHWPF